MIYASLSLLYLLYAVYIFEFKEDVASLKDYFIAFKPFVYILILSMAIGKRVFSQSDIRRAFYFLCFVFLVKYIFWLIIGNTTRPGVFTENNFELMLPMMLFVSLLDNKKRVGLFRIFLLGTICLLSGSRSGLIVFLVVMYFTNFGYERIEKYLKVILLSIFVPAIMGLFIYRLGSMSIEEIDRVVFLSVFVSEISSWNFVEFLFGNPILTNLSIEGANRLSYYYLLFSDPEQSIAYSVVFHSFILRMIFDHGLMGLIFVLFFVFNSLSKSGYSINTILSIICIMLLNGLSVSSFSSVFFFMGMVILLMQDRGLTHRANS
ncbi:hypothetical protein [Ferrimonas sp. SCSIO 43195]|uniref:hypothetical protein n=1 Tax=Ferrimonas sp. SCSIO 43195 TaxID=2822844 RepID=UPI0020763A18|nr:hypothetical protein [Ferrimonas sp. SCSIO 43195]USD38673.1 hypothetical protein J8Z22_06090 [Ferrimonas sp. SCSIO 43195]